MTIRKTGTFIQLLRRIASPATASVVMIAIFIGIGNEQESEASGRTFLQVQEMFKQFPSEIRSRDGIWLQRRRVPVPTGQAELLGKSAVVSREYARLRTFPQVSAIFFMVYCAEPRMMAGHHPPNCYPSSGWELIDEKTARLSVDRPDGRVIDATIYEFHRPNKTEDTLAIVSGFFRGDGQFFSTLGEASEDSRPSLLGGSGLFQFQILLQGGLSAADVRQYGREILLGIPNELFDEITNRSMPDEEASNLGGVW